MSRLSGPLLDRIDIQVRLRPLNAAQLITAPEPSTPSEVVAKRVAEARMAALARWDRVNAVIPGPALRRAPWCLPVEDTKGLTKAVDRGLLSARGFDRVLRLAWTIADLDGRDRPARGAVEEALQLRMGESRGIGN
jgi:magnesium chelatase family protein